MGDVESVTDSDVLAAAWMGDAHAALLTALRRLGSDDAAEQDVAARVLTKVQRLLVTQLSASPRESGRRTEPLLSLLQLCATVREGVGAPHAIQFCEALRWLPSSALVADASRSESNESRRQWLAWRGTRGVMQARQLSAAGFECLEPLVAVHVAMLRKLKRADTERVRLLVESARDARREGELRAAQAHLWCANAELQAMGAAGAATWACRWQQSKLLWAEGGERAADAMRLARQLCAEMGREEARLTSEQQAVRARTLRTLGGWMEALRSENRGLIEKDVLGKALNLAEKHQGDPAVSKTLLELARFYERQYESLSAETSSSSFERLRSVKRNMERDLRRTQEELLRLTREARSQPDGKLDQATSKRQARLVKYESVT